MVGSLAQGAVNQVTYAAFTGGRINYAQIIGDAFGNALGNAFADRQFLKNLDLLDDSRAVQDFAFKARDMGYTPEEIGSSLQSDGVQALLAWRERLNPRQRLALSGA